jgi:hypothetical protein
VYSNTTFKLQAQLVPTTLSAAETASSTLLGKCMSDEGLQALIRPPALARAMVSSPNFAIQQQQNENANTTTNTSSTSSNNNNITTNPQMMPSKAGTKHAHANAYVVSTVFILVEMYDAKTVAMAQACLRALDDQCQLLNPTNGSVPEFVFVALNIEKEEGGIISEVKFPEVLLDDVVGLSKQLQTARGRVDEVTLVF